MNNKTETLPITIDAQKLTLWHLLTFALGKIFFATIILVVPFHMAIGMWFMGIGPFELDLILAAVCGLLWAIIGWRQASQIRLKEHEWNKINRALRYTTFANLLVILCIVFVMRVPLGSGVVLVFPLMIILPLLISVPYVSTQLGYAKQTKRKFLVFKRSTGETEQVMPGFCWPATLLGPLWLIFGQMWLYLGAYVVLCLVLNFVSDYAINTKNTVLTVLTSISYLTVAIVMGMYGNTWLITSLRQRGYEQIDAE